MALSRGYPPSAVPVCVCRGDGDGRDFTASTLVGCPTVASCLLQSTALRPPLPCRTPLT